MSTAPSPVLRHVCEVCGKTEDLTPEDAFQEGWDYPPRMGAYGVVSQRTCPSCPIDRTLWWRITTEGPSIELTDRERETLARIQAEPQSILLSN